MSANNADARHNVAGYVVHSQDIVTQQMRYLRSHNKNYERMQILTEVFFVVALKQLTKLLLHQRLEASSPEFVCRGVVIVNTP
jgi:hypothetical protein